MDKQIVFLKIDLFFIVLILTTPLLQSFYQMVNGFSKNGKLIFNVKESYREIIKVLLMGFTQKKDLIFFLLAWGEFISIAFLLGVVPFFIKVNSGGGNEGVGILNIQENFLTITILIILLNLFLIFRTKIIGPSRESIIKDRMIIEMELVIFLAIVNYLNIKLMYDTKSFLGVIKDQNLLFSTGLPKWGILINPFASLNFILLAIINCNGFIPEGRGFCFRYNNQIIIEKYLCSLRILCFSIFFTYLFLGGSQIETSFILSSPFDLVILLLKIMIVYSLFIILNYNILWPGSLSFKKNIILWMIPMGTISILYSLAWKTYAG